MPQSSASGRLKFSNTLFEQRSTPLISTMETEMSKPAPDPCDPPKSIVAVGSRAGPAIVIDSVGTEGSVSDDSQKYRSAVVSDVTSTRNENSLVGSNPIITS